MIRTIVHALAPVAIASAIAMAGLSVAHAESNKSHMTTKKGFPPAPKSKVKINGKAQIAKAKARILYSLKDPDSAKWRQAAVDDYGNVCIEVNGKNSYGGYTGFTEMHFNPIYNSVDDSGAGCGSMRMRGKFIVY